MQTRPAGGGNAVVAVVVVAAAAVAVAAGADHKHHPPGMVYQLHWAAREARRVRLGRVDSTATRVARRLPSLGFGTMAPCTDQTVPSDEGKRASSFAYWRCARL